MLISQVIAHNANSLPPLKSNSVFVVNKDWFWESVNCEARLDETKYIFEECVENKANLVENKANLSLSAMMKPPARDINKKIRN